MKCQHRCHALAKKRAESSASPSLPGAFEGNHTLYTFQTRRRPNAVVAPIHPKAMPVILTTDEKRDVWMRAMGGGEGAAAATA
jgi:putative SOS response-associated peptidase YedK